MIISNNELTKIITCMAVLCMAVHGDAAVTSCSDVSNRVIPCIMYVTDKGPLTTACCSGVSDLNAAANTAVDRQTACRCLKTIVGQIPGVDHNAVAGLPNKCGVKVPYPISPATDCSKVN